MEVTTEAQQVDVYNVPDPNRDDVRAEMGLLGELSAVNSMFEAFQNTPNLSIFRDCVRKQLTLYHRLLLDAGLDPKPDDPEEEKLELARVKVPFPMLVIICTGRPNTVIADYSCTPRSPGVFHGVPGMSLRIVVLSEVPRTRETLLLRLMGRRKVLRDAIIDLAALPDDALEKQIAERFLVMFQIVRTPNEEDDMIEEAERIVREHEEKMRTEGVLIGERKILLRQLRTRFGDLSDSVLSRVKDAAPGRIGPME